MKGVLHFGVPSFHLIMRLLFSLISRFTIWQKFLKYRLKNSHGRGENYFQLKLNQPNNSLFSLPVALAELEICQLKNKKQERRRLGHPIYVDACTNVRWYVYMHTHRFKTIQLQVIISTRSCLTYNMTVELGKSTDLQPRPLCISSFSSREKSFDHTALNKLLAKVGLRIPSHIP